MPDSGSGEQKTWQFAIWWPRTGERLGSNSETNREYGDAGVAGSNPVAPTNRSAQELIDWDVNPPPDENLT